MKEEEKEPAPCRTKEDFSFMKEVGNKGILGKG